MIIKPEQLSARLKQGSHALIWISGDESLLVQEACDVVREFARNQGFGEREVMDAGANFNWTQLLTAGSSLSLFAERKLIDLRLHTAKLEEEARSTLEAYLENPNPDYLLLLTTAKIDKASQSTKWFKNLEAKALFCQVWPISEQQLPQWIRQRLSQHGLTADQDAVQILADRVEGNLLAAAQEIEKLLLQTNEKHLDIKTVMAAVADSSRYNVFDLIEASLAGNSSRALKILTHLQAEGEECLMLVSMLVKEIRSLASMLDEIDQGQNMHAVMQNHRVWSNRVQLVAGALQKHNQSSLQMLLDKARIVDQSVKGLLDKKPWDELANLVLGLSNTRLFVSMV
ncbi:MAG: DNA polymerase III subunit delta [Pseudomonadota bacterium]